MSNVRETLASRGACYGSFDEQARISQGFKQVMLASPNWTALPPQHRESLELIAMKMSRILNGDYNHFDSWHDIAGYAELVADHLKSCD